MDNKLEGQGQTQRNHLEAVAEVWVRCDTVGVLKTERKDGNEVYFGEKIDRPC